MNRRKPTFRVNKKILAIHEAIADKLIEQPDLIEHAYTCLHRRYENKLVPYRSYIVWDALLPLLNTNPKLFKEELLAEDKKMESLRRETIFVNILTEEERVSVFEQVRSNTINED